MGYYYEAEMPQDKIKYFISTSDPNPNSRSHNYSTPPPCFRAHCTQT